MVVDWGDLMTGTTIYGSTVHLPGVCAAMSIQALLDLAERHGCVRLQNAAGDVFRRRARGIWAYVYTKR